MGREHHRETGGQRQAGNEGWGMEIDALHEALSVQAPQNPAGLQSPPEKSGASAARGNMDYFDPGEAARLSRGHSRDQKYRWGAGTDIREERVEVTCNSAHGIKLRVDEGNQGAARMCVSISPTNRSQVNLRATVSRASRSIECRRSGSASSSAMASARARGSPAPTNIPVRP